MNNFITFEKAGFYNNKVDFCGFCLFVLFSGGFWPVLVLWFWFLMLFLFVLRGFFVCLWDFFNILFVFFLSSFCCFLK